ncbi:MAG TPA: MGMT family protein [Abditibacterium sp.]|jgi:alkylated DNA nucleotide flippase Atl1
MNNSDEKEIAAREALRLRVQVMKLAQEVLRGRVISYGALGKRCEPPISGYVCGRVMAQVLDDVPWWRVVGKDGNLPISKRGPGHSERQRELLGEEGVEFDENGRVLKSFFED